MNKNKPSIELTKREYFAIKALVALISRGESDTAENFAKISVGLSDALLKELEK